MWSIYNKLTKEIGKRWMSNISLYFFSFKFFFSQGLSSNTLSVKKKQQQKISISYFFFLENNFSKAKTENIPRREIYLSHLCYMLLFLFYLLRAEVIKP